MSECLQVWIPFETRYVVITLVSVDVKTIQCKARCFNRQINLKSNARDFDRKFNLRGPASG